MIWVRICLLSAAIVTVSVSAQQVPCLPGSDFDLSTQKPTKLVITVDAAVTKQTIRDFGASDCWSIQYVGLWPDEKKNRIADLLFSTELDEHNNPKGIGLSLWRFNVGSGSSRNKNPKTQIRSAWRRTEAFFDDQFKDYDFSHCPGQRWFLQAAKQRGVEQFLAFVNSPPVTMTKNGLGYCSKKSGSTNLRPDKVSDFSQYLAAVLKHFNENENIHFNYISPVNEPQWDWNERNQEGCRYNNQDIANLVEVLHHHLQEQKLDTQILITEAASIEYLYGKDSRNGKQIERFFKSGSSTFLGDKLPSVIGGHSYWTDQPKELIPARQKLRKKLDQYPNLEYAMTEYCLLGPGGSGRDLTIKSALRVARIIHFDMVIANTASWQWWLAVSPYRYKDGLVYIDPNIKDANVYESKMLWAMGNYSRFIRPGARRIETSRTDHAKPKDTIEGLMSSAYWDSQSQRVITVLINASDKPYELQLQAKNLPEQMKIKHWIPYLTNEEKSLSVCKKMNPGQTISIPPQSIATFVGSY